MVVMQKAAMVVGWWSSLGVQVVVVMGMVGGGKFGRGEEGSGAEGFKCKTQKVLCVPYVPCAEILRGARRQGR